MQSAVACAVAASEDDTSGHAGCDGGRLLATAGGSDMDAMRQVREGMRVVGPDGKKVGTVEDFKMGDPDAVTAEGQALSETSVARVAPGGLIAEFINKAELPRHLAERLLRIGYVKIDRSGFLAGHAYLGADELDRVEDDTLWLKTATHKAAKHSASSCASIQRCDSSRGLIVKDQYPSELGQWDPSRRLLKRGRVGRMVPWRGRQAAAAPDDLALPPQCERVDTKAGRDDYPRWKGRDR